MGKSRTHYGDDLVNWLNGESPVDLGRNSQASRQRVLELRSAIETVSSFLGRSKHGATTEEVRAAQEKVKVAAVRYPTGSEVEIRAATGPAKWRFRKGSTPGIPYGESRAVWRLFELAKTGSFNLLRKCECGRWFFAKREDSLGCCPAHQRKAYEKTERFKAYRRDYMRAYYAENFKAE